LIVIFYGYDLIIIEFNYETANNFIDTPALNTGNPLIVSMTKPAIANKASLVGIIELLGLDKDIEEIQPCFE
jgi:hypothetical protein